jgi:hypothetical protein|tara:strand:- start:27 stop:236 length:210 start_codon:yes stop_codon:yes gene_type:complete
MAKRIEWHGRVLQGGMPVASVTCEGKRRMLAELHHYAAMYSQDGSVELQTRTGKNRWRDHTPEKGIEHG